MDFIHRTAGHQRLKRFLHPNCNVCAQEFPARMEWVEHRFTPDHLRKLKEVMDSKVGGEGTVNYLFVICVNFNINTNTNVTVLS